MAARDMVNGGRRLPDGRADRADLPETVPQGTPARIEIAQALRNGWLEIWYQPKIDLRRKCLAGAEALARIRHPELGVLLPQSFLPETDEDDVVSLAQHAMLATMRDWSTFDRAGFNLHLAINVPVAVLLRLPIPTIVRDNRPREEHWPGLIVEVNEDQIVRDIALANEIAKQLKISGVTVSIDDFGGGYSSFASLRELPFAELKLDHTFVKDCAIDGTNGAICQTAIDLAHRFGRFAVAERDRKHLRFAGPAGDAMRFRPGHSARAADADRALHRSPGPAPQQAGQAAVGGGACRRRWPRRLKSGLTRAEIRCETQDNPLHPAAGSRNGSGASPGNGARKTLSVIEIRV